MPKGFLSLIILLVSAITLAIVFVLITKINNKESINSNSPLDPQKVQQQLEEFQQKNLQNQQLLEAP